MNQYKKARERGLSPGDPEWPQQAKTRPPMHERTKEKIRETKARNVLEELMRNPDTPPSVRVSAASKLLDKEEASLSTVDSTTRDVTEKMSEEQLIAKLRTLVENNPELMSKVMGDHARSSDEKIKVA